MQQLKKQESPLLKVAIVALIVLVIVLVRATWNVYRKSVITAEKREQAESEMALLEDRRNFLESENNRLETMEGVDEEIRRQFGFAESGERVFIILDEPEIVPTSTRESSFFDRFLGWFSGDE